MVGVAQLVRAPGCGPGGRGFKSHHSPFFTEIAKSRMSQNWESGGIGRRARLRI